MIYQALYLSCSENFLQRRFSGGKVYFMGGAIGAAKLEIYMSITIAGLIKNLKTKNQAVEVEYVICKTNGELVSVDVAKQAKPLIKMLKLFSYQ